MNVQMRLFSASIGLLALAWAQSTLMADTVILNDGQELDGVVTGVTDDRIILETPGGDLVLKKEQIDILFVGSEYRQASKDRKAEMIEERRGNTRPPETKPAPTNREPVPDNEPSPKPSGPESQSAPARYSRAFIWTQIGASATEEFGLSLMNKVRNFSLSGTASVVQLGEDTRMGGMPIFADSGYQTDFYDRFFLRIRGNGYWLRHEQDQAEFATDFVDAGTAFTKAGTGYFNINDYWRFYGTTSVGYGFQGSDSGLRIEPTMGYGFETYSMTVEGDFFGITNALNGFYYATEDNQLRGFWPSYSVGLKLRYLAQNGIEVYVSAEAVYARGNLDLTIERFSAGVILGIGIRGARYSFRKEGYTEELGVYIPLTESLDISMSVRGQQENFFLEEGDYSANTPPVYGSAPLPFLYYFGAPLPSKLEQKSNSVQIGIRYRIQD